MLNDLEKSCIDRCVYKYNKMIHYVSKECPLLSADEGLQTRTNSSAVSESKPVSEENQIKSIEGQQESLAKKIELPAARPG